MKQLLGRLWYRWMRSAFVTGVFACLPIVMTVMIMGWVGQKLVALVGPQALIGGLLRGIGLHLVTDPAVATMVGWFLVLLGMWALGIFIQATTRHRLDTLFHSLMHRIPIVGAVYKPVSQVVGLLNREAPEDLQQMSVVFCTFGAPGGAGMLGLLASPERFRIQTQDYRLIFLPTAPLPMTGGLVFVPVQYVTKAEMSVDDLLKLYCSLGILSSQVLPAPYRMMAQDGPARVEAES
jgi:uncharacterized membrane protein